MRTFLSLAAAAVLALFLGLDASAQERSTTDVVLSYSYIRANPSSPGSSNFNINGGSASVTFNPHITRGWLGLTGEFGGYRVGDIAGANVDSNLFTYMGGPQVNLPSIVGVAPFARVLFGAAHSTGSALSLSGSRNSYAMAPGIGADFHLTKHLSLRAGPVEYLLTDFKETPFSGREVQHNFRVSTGLRWRF